MNRLSDQELNELSQRHQPNDDEFSAGECVECSDYCEAPEKIVPYPCPTALLIEETRRWRMAGKLMERRVHEAQQNLMQARATLIGQMPSVVAGAYSKIHELA